MKTAVSFYPRSRSCYKTMKKYLELPHRNTIKNYFGSPITGELRKSENTIKSIFIKMIDNQRCCKILIDEIRV